eukprot:3233596-Pleurochrysis_carterae.AAC.1
MAALTIPVADFVGVQAIALRPLFTCEKNINDVIHTLILGCYVDGFFVLYSDDAPNSLYSSFTTALSTRWNVEDEGLVSDLLNVDIATDADCVLLKQEKYTAQLVDTYLPEGIAASFHKNHAPAGDDLPRLVDKHSRPKHRALRPTRRFAPPTSHLLACCCTALRKSDLTSHTLWACCAEPCHVRPPTCLPQPNGYCSTCRTIDR